MRLVWMPQALCQNYTLGQSYGTKCPYCPYSFDKSTNRLIFDDKLASPNSPPATDDLIGFLRTNRDSFEGHVTITGGEPLLFPQLAEILVAADYSFDPTSNTIAPLEVIKSLPLDRLRGCWTASYHPLSGNDATFLRNIQYLQSQGVLVAITVVFSEHTRESMPKSIEFVKSLMPMRIQFHLDAHHDAEHLRAEAATYGFPIYAGAARKDVICRRHENLMAVGPDGSLFECVTKMYQYLDPIVKVSAEIDVRYLAPRIELCGLDCFAVCDFAKHHAFLRNHELVAL